MTSSLISAILILVGLWLWHYGMRNPEDLRPVDALIAKYFPNVYGVLRILGFGVATFLILIAVLNLLGIIDLRNPC